MFYVPQIYEGSTKLAWISKSTGLPIDQVNYIVAQLTALICAIIFNLIFSKKKTTAKVKHSVVVFVGLFLSFFCFGRQFIHLICYPTISYSILHLYDCKINYLLCLGFSMLYLCCLHLQRVIYNYGEYILDVTGPLMIMVQKVTSLAFSLHDGQSNKDSLSVLQRKLQISKLPSLLEYYSYLYNFQGIIMGPLVFYSDYAEFIEGKHLEIYSKMNKNTFSVFLIIFQKVSISFLFAFGVFLSKMIPVYFFDSSFLIRQTFLRQMGYLFIVTSVSRWKYYHAWLLGDAINNASGLGFSGFDKKSKPQLNLISNVNILKVEFALSLRNIIENWNINTTYWLRLIAYDRIQKRKVLVTYLLSAAWHGFYPGYYFTFMGGALFTEASRKVRKYIRPYFTQSLFKKQLYDVLTMITTHLVLTYISFPFVLLDFWSCLQIYKQQYFWLHILAIFTIVFFPYIFNLPFLKPYSEFQINSNNRMAICGPKLSLCMLILSIWGIIQLVLMGGLFYIHSVAFAEDLSLNESYVNINDFYADLEAGYVKNAHNCWIAACLYLLTFIISGWQYLVNQRNM